MTGGWRRRLLGGDRRGLAAIEFALIAPILVTAYVATAEVSLAIIAYRKLGLSAAVAADLASHSSRIDAPTVRGIFEATAAVMAPFDAGTLVQRLSGIVVAPDGSATVDWSMAAGIDPLAAGSPVTLPPGLVVAGEGVVMAEAWFDYVSPMTFTLPGIGRFADVHFVYPRFNDRVLWE